MSNQTAFKRRPAIIFNDFRQSLPETIAPLNGGKYPATLQWEISGDRDKVYLKINDGVYGAQDQNAKLKCIEMGWVERNALFEILRQAATDKEFTASQMSVYDKSYNNNDRLPLRATLTVMRGNSGEIRLHYRKSTYEATFVMSCKRLVISKKSESGAWTAHPGMSSACYTISYITALTAFMNENEFTHFKPRERKDDGNTPQRNGNNNYQNANSSNSEPDFDADLDF